MEKPGRKIILKYALVQIPGIAAASAIAAVLRHWLDLPLSAAVAGVALWVVKDVVMFFFTWHAYAGGEPAGSAMTGLEGETLERIAPTGRVCVRGENWAARATEGTADIEEGSTVRVVAVDGLTLVVSPVRSGAPPSGSG